MLGACRSAPERPADDPIFAQASGPLRIGASGEGGPSLGWLVREHARLCGFEFVLGEATRLALEGESVGLQRELAVPRGEVTTTVEALLSAHGWVYAVGREFPARTVWLERADEAIFGSARAVDPAELARYAEHRAVVIETMVPSPGAGPLDASALRTAEPRLLIQDFSSERTVFLRGPAHDVALLARALADASGQRALAR